YVIGIDLLDQATLFEALRESLVVKMMSVRERFKASSLPAGPWSLSSAIIGLLGLVCMAAVWRRRRLSRLPGADAVPSSPPAFYVRFLFLLRRAGLVRGRGETPLEFSGRAAACLPAPAGRRIREITQLYYLIRFDPAAGLEKESRRLAGLLLRDLRSCLRR
ncbi:MAG: DUF4129 domain-containing protein, partial [Acidobacteriota bacterium]